MADFPHDPIQVVMPRQMYEVINAAFEDTGYTTIRDPDNDSARQVVESYIVVPKAMEAAATEMINIAHIISKRKQPDV